MNKKEIRKKLEKELMKTEEGQIMLLYLKAQEEQFEEYKQKLKEDLKGEKNEK